ncbi:uncharacterized protein PG998_002659 [Apiospora kogelbergensis]|uniref:uncharacterized protein n=1 Tax=Apiospora kogelbergensis TaxID=1337665 RepID=UPI00312FBCE6
MEGPWTGFKGPFAWRKWLVQSIRSPREVVRPRIRVVPRVPIVEADEEHRANQGGAVVGREVLQDNGEARAHVAALARQPLVHPLVPRRGCVEGGAARAHPVLQGHHVRLPEPDAVLVQVDLVAHADRQRPRGPRDALGADRDGVVVLLLLVGLGHERRVQAQPPVLGQAVQRRHQPHEVQRPPLLGAEAEEHVAREGRQGAGGAALVRLVRAGLRVGTEAGLGQVQGETVAARHQPRVGVLLHALQEGPGEVGIGPDLVPAYAAEAYQVPARR